jgi:hypothetical protein
MQHILGEFYGNNPGVLSPLNMVAYTLQSLEVTPAGLPISLSTWETRLQLSRLRMRRWVQVSEVDVGRLASMRRFWRKLEYLRGLLGASEVFQGEGGGCSLPVGIQERFANVRKQLIALLYRVGVEARVVGFSPGAIYRFLEEDDPGYNLKAR